MEAIGRLAGGIAHDFNNILTAILGYAEFSELSLSADDPLRSNLEEIHRAGTRAAELTRQLLAFARKQIIGPRVVNVNELILRMDKMLARLIGENIELVKQLNPELGLTKIDPGQFEQIIINLVLNARDAMLKAEGS
jgi:two-component system cell cycle sensor histidine kinase/response regulator CckA